MDDRNLLELIERAVAAAERIARRLAPADPLAGTEPQEVESGPVARGVGAGGPHDAGHLTPAQAADRIGCSRSMVYRLMGRGELAYFKVGRQYRIEAASVDAYRRASAVERSVDGPPPGGYRFKHL